MTPATRCICAVVSNSRGEWGPWGVAPTRLGEPRGSCGAGSRRPTLGSPIPCFASLQHWPGPGLSWPGYLLWILQPHTVWVTDLRGGLPSVLCWEMAKEERPKAHPVWLPKWGLSRPSKFLSSPLTPSLPTPPLLFGAGPSWNFSPSPGTGVYWGLLSPYCTISLGNSPPAPEILQLSPPETHGAPATKCS